MRTFHGMLAGFIGGVIIGLSLGFLFGVEVMKEIASLNGYEVDLAYATDAARSNRARPRHFSGQLGDAASWSATAP